MAGREVRWRAEGASGAAISDLIRAIGELDPKPDADVVLVSIGVNDVTGLSSSSRWRRQVGRLADALRERWPDALIVFAGLPQMECFPLPPQPLKFCLGWRARSFDRVLAAQLANRPRMLHIGTRIDPRRHAFCPDGFHPSAATSVTWGRELAARLAETLVSAAAENRLDTD
jgi:lysophospholipase L1-like esterase